MASKLKRLLKKVAKPVAVIAAVVFPPLIPAIGVALGATGAAAAVVGAAALSTGASLASGDSVKDALKGGVISGLTAGIVPGVTSSVSNALGGGVAGNIAARALTGGATSSLLGGDFAQGALTGGIIGGINQYQQALNLGDFDRAMTESGLAGQTLMSDADQLLSEIQPSASLDIAGIENKTNLFGLARGLTPAAVSLLLQKSAYKNATKDDSGQTRYSIVAPPTDWKPPEYNQTFTPSAPIDFGTPALLAGTQWETPQQTQAPQPYTLTNLINTLNYQPVPFVPQQYDMPQQVSTADFVNQFQQPTVGTTEIIGELGGSPVSIADIISGIQSQYGQKTSS